MTNSPTPRLKMDRLAMARLLEKAVHDPKVKSETKFKAVRAARLLRKLHAHEQKKSQKNSGDAPLPGALSPGVPRMFVDPPGPYSSPKELRDFLTSTEDDKHIPEMAAARKQVEADIAYRRGHPLMLTDPPEPFSSLKELQDYLAETEAEKDHPQIAADRKLVEQSIANRIANRSSSDS